MSVHKIQLYCIIVHPYLKYFLPRGTKAHLLNNCYFSKIHYKLLFYKYQGKKKSLALCLVFKTYHIYSSYILSPYGSRKKSSYY